MYMFVFTALILGNLMDYATINWYSSKQQSLTYEQYFSKVIQLYFNYLNINDLDDGIVKNFALGLLEEDVKEYVREYPQFAERFIRGELPGLNGGNASELERMLLGFMTEKLDDKVMDSYIKAGQWFERIKRRL